MNYVTAKKKKDIFFGNTVGQYHWTLWLVLASWLWNLSRITNLITYKVDNF